MSRHLLATCCILLSYSILPRPANATCGEECDQQYSSDVDDCHSNYGDDPADADDLASCIQDARDDYQSCLDDCTSAMRTRQRNIFPTSIFNRARFSEPRTCGRTSAFSEVLG